MKRSTLSIIITVAGLCLACKTRDPISGYYKYETECLARNFDGTQTLRTWGTGKSMGEARNRAFQEALQDVLFEGVRNGDPECDLVPLITEANARTKYENYFNHFFSEKGNYRDFISLARNNRFEINSRSNLKEAYAYVVEVNVPALKQQLKTDDIIP